ncbi:MAG: hypothetical protein AAF215_29780 [Cyanobacteria bacterium P01_A01_bin.123]
MKGCPCCSTALLRHIRQGSVYWYCNNCHQEMPNFDERIEKRMEMVNPHRLKQFLGVSTTREVLQHMR